MDDGVTVAFVGVEPAGVSFEADVRYELVIRPTVARRTVEWVVADGNALLEVTGDAESIHAAASYVREHGFTPFESLHLVNPARVPVVPSDGSSDGFAERISLEPER